VRLLFGQNERFDGETLNLSPGGFFVPMKQPKPIGTLVRFELLLHDGGKPLAGFGEVVWLRVRSERPEEPVGCAIQLRYLADQDLARIGAAVHGQEARFAGLARSGPAAEPSFAGLEGLEDLAEPAFVPFELPPVTEDPFRLAESPPGAAGPASGSGAFPLPPPRPAQPPVFDPTVPPASSEVDYGAAFADEPPSAQPAPGPQPVLFATPSVGLEGPARSKRRKLLLALVALGVAGIAALALLWPGLEEPAPARLAQKAPTSESATAEPPVPATPASPSAEPAEVTAKSPAEAPAVEPVAEPAPALRPFTRLVRLRAESDAGRTVVYLDLDGSPAEAKLSSVRIDSGSPRQLVRLAGVGQPVDPAALEIRGTEVRRIRTGLHGQGAAAQMHVVVDLATQSVQLESLTLEPQAVKLTFTVPR
jgi:hypothetical protein